MKTQTVNTNTKRSVLIVAAALGMLLFSITPSFGQKEDFEARRATSRDGLIDTGFMTKADVSDDLDGSEDEYFYKFLAKPGKLTATLEVNANETNAGAYLDLFGINSKAILSNLLVQGVDGGSERVSRSVNIAKAQTIIIRIKGLKYGSSGGYTGTYKISLEGPAASFKDAAPADGTVQAKEPDAASPGQTGQSEEPAAQSDGTGQDKKSAAAPADATDPGNKPDAVDRAIEKVKTKNRKLRSLLDRVKAKIPD